MHIFEHTFTRCNNMVLQCDPLHRTLTLRKPMMKPSKPLTLKGFGDIGTVATALEKLDRPNR